MERKDIWTDKCVVTVENREFKGNGEWTPLFQINGEELARAITISGFTFKEDFGLLLSFAVSKLSHALAVACYSSSQKEHLLTITLEKEELTKIFVPYHDF